MAHDVTDDLERRLRAARPRAAHIDEDAFDADLLARVREQPIARAAHRSARGRGAGRGRRDAHRDRRR